MKFFIRASNCNEWNNCCCQIAEKHFLNWRQIARQFCKKAHKCKTKRRQNQKANSLLFGWKLYQNKLLVKSHKHQLQNLKFSTKIIFIFSKFCTFHQSFVRYKIDKTILIPWGFKYLFRKTFIKSIGFIFVRYNSTSIIAVLLNACIASKLN